VKKIFHFYQSLFFSNRFFLIWAVLLLLLFLGYWFPFSFLLGKFLFIAFLILTLGDLIYITTSGKLIASRPLPDKFSNGDPNPVNFHIHNHYPLTTYVQIIDEIPPQFQKRDFHLRMKLARGEHRAHTYYLKPVKRGIYNFGKLHLFASSPLGLIKWKSSFEKEKEVKVYPAFIQMKKYELIALTKQRGGGLKKIRRLGHSMEFEQIKIYTKGDDYRTINWKATAKHNRLMVNQYQDQTSQNVYSIIDMGRTMKMPFHQMTLLDYAINSTLSFSNIVLKKHDKAGLLAFEQNINAFIKPDQKKAHLHKIFESLYHLKTGFKETDYEKLFNFINYNITNRSLLMLYTNFEHFSSFRRQLPFLKKLAKKHLLVVIIFENTELNELLEAPITGTSALYSKIIAEDFLRQKKRMIKEMKLYNIHAVLTPPEDLTIQTINKYLELKKRGLI